MARTSSTIAKADAIIDAINDAAREPGARRGSRGAAARRSPTKTSKNPARRAAGREAGARRGTVSASAAKMPTRKNPRPASSPTTRLVRKRVANPVRVERETSRNDYALVSGDHWTVRFFANKTKPAGVADITYPAMDEASARRFVASLEKAGAHGVAVIALRKVRAK